MAGDKAPAPAATEADTVPVKITVAGTKGGAFRFRNGALDQFRLDDSRKLTVAQAKRLAEAYIAIISESTK